MTDWTPDRIKQFRVARGLTQEQLARDLEVTVSTINRTVPSESVAADVRTKPAFPITYDEFKRYLEMNRDRWFFTLPDRDEHGNLTRSWACYCPLARCFKGQINGLTWIRHRFVLFGYGFGRVIEGELPFWARRFVTDIDSIVTQWKEPEVDGSTGCYGADALRILQALTMDDGHHVVYHGNV